MTVTKGDIIERVCARLHCSRGEGAELVEAVFEIIKHRLEQGEKVKISGFGNFTVREKRPRRGRNPQTGEEIIIRGRRVLSFKPSHVFKRAVNHRLTRNRTARAVEGA
ncbi:MAG: integration host factor subunit alpha [Candidatus Binatia bacterium]|nr:MAG: integration host factor subunit alpha [Candidatus Binatia bacterium]